MNRQQRRAASRVQQTSGGNLGGATGIPGLLAAAIRHHRAGHLPEAEAHYRRILAIRPDYAEVLFNLGVALKQQDRFAEAIVAYRQTIELTPSNAEAHYNLGNLLFGLNRPGDAVDSYRQAVRIRPQHADAYCNLGVALKCQGKLDDAIGAFRQATAINADHAEAYCNLGDAQTTLCRFDDAVASFRQALRIKPDTAPAYRNLGIALTGQGKLDEAIIAFCRAIELRPDDGEARYNLGNALKGLGRIEEAAAAYRQAIAIRPDLVEAHVNFGNALNELGQPDAAIAAYGRALEIRPESAEAHYNIGNVLKDQGKLEEAAAAYREAIVLKAEHAEAHANLAIVLMSQGRLGEAIAEYRRAMTIKPDDAEIHSNYLLCLTYSDTETPQSLLAAHREWDRRFGRPAVRPAAYGNDRTPSRRLRIGYVSPDLRSHSVAFFFEPFLKAHDPQISEAFCYADVIRPDAVTARLQGLSDHWLSTVGMSDDGLAERIRADRIDILVDLAGHTAWNRLRVFARKPAPVQVTWLGYPHTTGVSAIDYRLADAVTDPVGSEPHSSEALLRLEGCCLCYGGLQGTSDPTVAPCQNAGAITFGSFNNPAKISPATFDAWAKVLGRLPSAHLLLKGKAFADAATRERFLANLGERGISADRVELVSWLPSKADHLALYDRIDIGLDPFPFNGITTTCEALWMGLPVVTLRSDRHCGRVAASLLTQIGMTDWIADSVDDYVRIAVALAENPIGLNEARRSLRARLLASSLCDAQSFARKVENGFRAIWQRWCEVPEDDPSSLSDV